MVALTPRFTLLATALSSIAAVSIIPSPAGAAAININDPATVAQSVAARHSGHEQTVADAADDRGHSKGSTGNHNGGNDGTHVGKKPQSKARKASGEPQQRTHKPTVPLPAALNKSGKKALAKESGGGETEGHGSRKQKHMKASVRVHFLNDFVH